MIDMGAENPYAEQTAANTGTPWLGAGPPVDVDLDGLGEYARRLTDQQADIGARSAYLAPLSEAPGKAWTGDVLGEADAVRAQLMANAAELGIYMSKLGESLRNVGTAARAIAERYRSGDAVAAAGLNDVLVAFGAAPPPAGTTAVGSGPVAASGQWRDGPVTPVSAYQTVQTSFGPGGERREISTVTVPGGATTVTTTVFDRAGETISASTSRTSVREDDGIRITREESFGADGTLTGTTETRQGYGESTTESVDEDGRTTRLVEEKVDPVSGASSTTTYEPNKSGLLEAVNRAQVGPRTPGPGGNG
ncbi:hypothetical protein AB0M02_46235 [Actinoplanes sp. NPDC051861]|uniref:hypothetical protein n=1 Tax=Actinoplanes sp. NPDC051861 TaxID=3155170 RepID=UPI003425D0EE